MRAPSRSETNEGLDATGPVSSGRPIRGRIPKACLVLPVLGLVFIGLLIVFFGPHRGLRKMPRQQAQVLAMSIGSAIKSYWAEYQQMPIPEGVGDAESKPIRSDAVLTETIIARL